jgi:parvulin-like peptidyl-prolyl isomerase
LARKKGEIAMNKGLAVAFAVMIAVLSLSCSRTEEKTVARLGQDVITVGMVEEQYLAISPQTRPDLMTIEEKEQFARDIVSKEILVLEARKIGIDRLPEVIEARRGALQRKAWQLFYEDKVRSQVQVTEAEIQELHEQQGYRYTLAWIFLRSRAIADEVTRRLANGEDFARLAEIYSMDASKERGGEIGARALGTMPGGTGEMVMNMSPGEVTEVIVYEGYYVLIKLLDKEKVEPPDMESARAGLESMARARGETALQRELVAELKEKYGLRFNQEVVDLIVAKTAETYPSEDTQAGLVPKFSDAEMAMAVAEHQGGQWTIRTYVERLHQQVPFLRPGYRADRETVESVIADFITGELWLLEISAGGYDQDPEALEFGGRAMEEAMVTAMHEDLVRGVEIDEEKLLSFYNEQKAELVTDAAVDLAMITLDSEEEALSVYEELQRGASFEQLARERSVDRATGEAGGKLPRALMQRQLETFPDIEEVVNKLQVGAYSRPVTMPMGFLAGQSAIVKLLKRIDSRPMEYNEVKDMLSQRVLQLEQDRTFGEWLRQKMEEYDVEIYPDGLGQIDFMELKAQGS